MVLWIFPGVVGSIGGTQSPLYRFCATRLPEGVASLVAALLLFVLPVNWRERRFTLHWSEGQPHRLGNDPPLRRRALARASLMFTTGLAEHIGRELVAERRRPLWGITAIAVVLAVAILTEMTSNTAATNMLVPVVIWPSRRTVGVSPVPPALAVAFGASMAFMLPISTPAQRDRLRHGPVPITAMIRCGLILDVVSFAIIVVGLRLLCPVLGLL